MDLLQAAPALQPRLEEDARVGVEGGVELADRREHSAEALAKGTESRGEGPWVEEEGEMSVRRQSGIQPRTRTNAPTQNEPPISNSKTHNTRPLGKCPSDWSWAG